MHEKSELESDVLLMTQQLRASTIQLGQSIEEDTSMLDKINSRAINNFSSLQEQEKKLKQHLHESIGLITSIILVLSLIVSFLIVFIFIKFTPKP